MHIEPPKIQIGNPPRGIIKYYNYYIPGRREHPLSRLTLVPLFISPYLSPSTDFSPPKSKRLRNLHQPPQHRHTSAEAPEATHRPFMARSIQPNRLHPFFVGWRSPQDDNQQIWRGASSPLPPLGLAAGSHRRRQRFWAPCITTRTCNLPRWRRLQIYDAIICARHNKLPGSTFDLQFNFPLLQKIRGTSEIISRHHDSAGWSKFDGVPIRWARHKYYHIFQLLRSKSNIVFFNSILFVQSQSQCTSALPSLLLRAAA